MTIKTITAIAALSTGLAFSAQADTIVFDPGAVGVDTLENNGDSARIDLNQDGFDDVLLRIGNARNNAGDGLVDTNFENLFIGGPGDGTFPLQFEEFYQEVFISATNGVADLFAAGDEIGPNTFNDSSRFETLFGGSDNALPNLGDSGYLGFRLDIGTSIYQNIDGFLDTGFNGTPESFYGFLFVEHGSINFGQAGFSNVAGAASVVPGGGGSKPNVVPLPASSLLLIAGLAGFGAVRRKAKRA